MKNYINANMFGFKPQSGLSSRDVGKKLMISFRTVDTHRNKIMKKLKVKKTSALILYSIKNGLVDISK